MSQKKQVFSFLSMLLGFINLVFFFFLLYIAKDNYNLSEKQNWVDPISIQFALMNIMLLCVTIFLAVSAFVGYNSLKDTAVNLAKSIALEKANEVASAQMSSFIQQQNEQQKSQQQYSEASSASEGAAASVSGKVELRDGL